MEEEQELSRDFYLHLCPVTQSNHDSREIERDHHQQTNKHRETSYNILLFLHISPLHPLILCSYWVYFRSSLFVQHAQDCHVAAGSYCNGREESGDAEKWKVVAASTAENI